MVRSAYPHNAHLLELSHPLEIRRALLDLGRGEQELNAEADRLHFLTIKLEQVDPRTAKLLRSHCERLSLYCAMRQDAGAGRRETAGVLLSGSLYALKELAGSLGGELAGEIAASLPADSLVMSWGRRTLDFCSRIYVMGVLNCTPDSFYPGSRYPDEESALAMARVMIEAGVDILDIGGESSRPGSDPVSAEEELRRVLPVIEAVRRESEVLISIDTRKLEVAQRALDAGADVVNDISALRDNRPLAELIALRRVPVVLMHMREEPKSMQVNPSYEDATSEIISELRASIAFALNAGIAHDRIIIDPGIGFGKRVKDNLCILKHLRSFQSLGCPILIGLSRKSFLGEILGAPVDKRLIGTITANTLAVLKGANIVRVHDVREAVGMVKVIEAVMQADV